MTTTMTETISETAAAADVLAAGRRQHLTCNLPADLDVAVHVALSHVACAHGDGLIESLAPLCGLATWETPATLDAWAATLRATTAFRLVTGEWGFTPPAWQPLLAAAEPILHALTTRKDIA